MSDEKTLSNPLQVISYQSCAAVFAEGGGMLDIFLPPSPRKKKRKKKREREACFLRVHNGTSKWFTRGDKNILHEGHSFHYVRNPRQRCVLIAMRLISRNSFLFNPRFSFGSSASFQQREEKRRDGKRKNGERSKGKKKREREREKRSLVKEFAAEFSTPFRNPYVPLQLFNPCFVDRDVIGSKKFTAFSMPFRGHVHDNVVEWQFHYWPATFSGEKSV